MIVTKKEEIIKIEEVVEFVKCDCCQREIKTDDHFEWQEILFIKIMGGYGSIFGDGTIVETQLCQYCVKKLLGEFLRESKENFEEEENE